MCPLLPVAHSSYITLPWPLLFHCRHEFASQMAHLSSGLSVLQSSFELMQDFVQLPTIHIWHQQLRQVMSQALLQELKALPPVQSCPAALLTPASRLLVQADRLLEPNQASRPTKLLESNQAIFDQLHQSGDTSGLSHQDSLARPSALPEQDTVPESVKLPNEAPVRSLPNQASLHSQQSLPIQAAASAQQHLPTLARPGPTTQQATARHLPKQASSSKSSFLTACLAELLRLSEPYSSQYQPLLCGWYDAEGEQLVDLG